MTNLDKSIRRRLTGAAFLFLCAVAQAGEVQGLDRPEAIANRYIVVFKPDALANQPAGERSMSSLASTLVKGRDAVVMRTYSHALQGALISAGPDVAKRLADDPRVAYVEADAVVRSQSVIDEIITQPTPGWGLDRIDQNRLPLNDLFQYPSQAGYGVNAYVLDTAIATGHPDFAGRIGTIISFVEGGGQPSPPGPGNPAPQSVDYSCFNHGTSVASVLAGTQFGVAKLATVHSVRVLDCAGDGAISWLVSGIDWVRANRVAPAVANLSVSGPSSQAVRDAVASLVAAGVTVVVAAGNQHTDACSRSPANAPAALTVAASIRADDSLADFSNYGSCVDLKAPGAEVATANAADAFEGGSGTTGVPRDGTSFSAPYVAGAAALMLSKYPAATPAEIASALLANVGETGVLRTSFLLSSGVPATPAALDVRSTGCYGENAVSWPYVAGANRYELWASTRSTFANPWLVGDYTVTQTIVDFAAVTHLRVRACNGWGCSAFSGSKPTKLATTCG